VPGCGIRVPGLPLHKMQLGRQPLDFAHVAMVDGGHLPIVPGDLYRVPARLGDNAAIGGVASPTNDGAFGKSLRFSDRRCHSPCPNSL
jgi:hypothetical protein